MDLSTKVGVWLPSATLTGVEEGRHHACNFLVYEATYNGISIQCKVKDQAEKMVYTMKIIKKGHKKKEKAYTIQYLGI